MLLRDIADLDSQLQMEREDYKEMSNRMWGDLMKQGRKKRQS